MSIGIAHLMNGNIQIVDMNDEDAPLVTVQFHNEAALLPLAMKEKAVQKLREALQLDFGPSKMEEAVKVAWFFSLLKKARWPWKS